MKLQSRVDNKTNKYSYFDFYCYYYYYYSIDNSMCTGPSRIMLTLYCGLALMVAALQGGLVGAQEMDALMGLKEAFQNPTSLSSWAPSNSSSSSARDPHSHCKGWRGVTCGSDTHHVVELSLPGLLLGSRPNPAASVGTFIKDLPYLERLDLSHNNLDDHIPPELYQLRSLTSLDLSRNRLTGPLPTRGWSNLTHLQTLYLHFNHLTGPIPSQLSEAVGLQSIVLKNNYLDGPIPSQLFSGAHLPGLKRFTIDSNNIWGRIPEEIGGCTSLLFFRAAHNLLKGTLPESIGNLSSLLQFVVDENQLSGPVPASLGNLQNMKVLNLSYNNFTGEVSANLSIMFDASSFLGNPLLCGAPTENKCTETPPPPPRPRGSDNQPPKASGRPSPPPKSTSGRKRLTTIIVPSAIGATVVLLLFIALVYARRRRLLASYSGQAAVPNWFGSDTNNMRNQARFSAYRQSFNKYGYEEIVANAGHFDTAHVLGKGRFATVYKAILPDGMAMVVKVFKHSNMPPHFEKHLDNLALLKHKNLLCIRGFFSSPMEKAILYDYLPMGTLHDLLHAQTSKGMRRLLDWQMRHKIALGVAQAMVYLHGNRIIHRDLKSTNILLQEGFVPKVSDFALIHLVSSGCDSNEASTPGYIAHEHLALAAANPSKRSFTEKTDVYSYGVVLLELITGQQATVKMKENAIRMEEDGRGRDAMDPYALRTCLWPEYMDKALNLAVRCLNENPNSRPTMADVVLDLDGLCPILSPLRKPSF